jgi:hypothetical protein
VQSGGPLCHPYRSSLDRLGQDFFFTDGMESLKEDQFDSARETEAQMKAFEANIMHINASEISFPHKAASYKSFQGYMEHMALQRSL